MPAALEREILDALKRIDSKLDAIAAKLEAIEERVVGVEEPEDVEAYHEAERELREFVERRIGEYEQLRAIGELERIIEGLPTSPRGTAARYVREDRDIDLKPLRKGDALARLGNPGREDDVLRERAKMRYDLA